MGDIMNPREFVMLWLLAVFALLAFAKWLGINGEFFAGIAALVGVVIGYYFGRRSDTPSSIP